MSDIRQLLEALTGSSPTDDQPSNNGKIKALAWARVSTDMQKERGLSIPEQLREIREYAEKDGIEIVEEYQEAASAFQNEQKRVEFHRMIERAKSDSEINVILVHDFSRFSRDSLQAMTWIKELSQAGVRVVSLNDPVVDPETVAGVFLGAITHAKNEAHSREIAFHVRKGQRANVQTRDAETGWCYKSGGKALWGYRLEVLERGKGRVGRPQYKTIWVLDDTVVAGKPLHEWVHYVLVELAAKGASYTELRDFCNKTGIPAPNDRYWGLANFKRLFRPDNLLKYAGYGVWNTRSKRDEKRPPSDWVIVPNAHPAIITEEEAQAVASVRQQARAKYANTGFGRGMSHTSDYLLTGGLFRCERCGRNMIGVKPGQYRYYVCGSEPYRRGLGCGKGVYVPVKLVEGEVTKGINQLLTVCSDPEGFVKKVNQELRRLWEETSGHDPNAERKIKDIDKKISNIRLAVEDGLEDATWANERLRKLREEQEKLEKAMRLTGPPPQIDPGKVLQYRTKVDRTLSHGEPAERKRYIRSIVQGISLDPENRGVEITYRVPDHFMENAPTL